MSSKPSAGQNQGDAGATSSPPALLGGPGGSDVAPDVAQYLVDQAAYFNIFSMPGASASDTSILAPSNSNRVIGIRVNEVLHRFAVNTQAPAADRPLTAHNIVGEPAGKFSHRWMIIPDDYVASPDREPPPTPLDPSRSQRFVMLNGHCTFGDGRDGFKGFGTGHTVPMIMGNGARLLALTVGTILEGFGKFEGHEEGIYLHCGSLTPNRGFTGNIMLRVMDREGTLMTDSTLPELSSRPNPEPNITYILFRGEAVPTDAVTPRIGPDGRPLGLIVEQGLRLFEVDFSGGSRGPKSTMSLGPFIGKITATVTFNPAAPGGTALNPIPFNTFDEIVFFDRSDGRRIGSFTGDSNEGRVFTTEIAGQPAIRFGGVGRILSGNGPFEGMQGLMTDNSLVVFSPHVSASVYVLRVYDPKGRFRS
jgi:hypothetical protein